MKQLQQIDNLDSLIAQAAQAGRLKAAWKAQGKQLKAARSENRQLREALANAGDHARLYKEAMGEPRNLSIGRRLLRDQLETIELICGEGLK